MIKHSKIVNYLFFTLTSFFIITIISAISINLDIVHGIRLLNSSFFWGPIKYSLKMSLLAAVIANVAGGFIAICSIQLSKLKRLSVWIICAISATLPAVMIINNWRLIIKFFSNEINIQLFDLSSFFYGQYGILFIYIYYNLPLAILAYGFKLIQIAPNNYRLAESLSLGFFKRVRLFYIPTILTIFPSTFLIVFYFCFQDFNIAYLLGSRPQNTTISLAIFQSLYLEADLITSSWFVAIFLIPNILLITIYFKKKFKIFQDQSTIKFQPTNNSKLINTISFGVCSLLIIFLISPNINIILSITQIEFNNLFEVIFIKFNGVIFTGLINSTIVSIGSALIAVILAYIYCVFLNLENTNNFLKASPWIILLSPQLAVAVGIFIFFNKINIIFIFNQIWFYTLINGIIYFPVISYIWKTPLEQNRKNYQHLINNLGLNKWQVFWNIDRKSFKNLLLIGYAISATLALNDLTIVNILSPKIPTLAVIERNLWSTYNFNLISIINLLIIGLIVLYYLPLFLFNLKKIKCWKYKN